MLPRRIPLAEIEEKARTMIKGVPLSIANHELPGPSGPAGQRTFWMLLNPDSEVEGEPSTSALCSGTETREEVKGVAPAENGTLGL